MLVTVIVVVVLVLLAGFVVVGFNRLHAAERQGQ